MTDRKKQRYDLYIDTPLTGLIKAAEAVLLEADSRLIRMGFRYTEAYRSHPHAFPLDPAQLPLKATEFNIPCAGGMPGVLDDYLPDDWGRKVLARLVFYREKCILDEHSAIDILSQLSNSRIGALQWVIYTETPDYGLGCDIARLAAAETAAQSIDNQDPFSDNLDEMSLLYLASAGTGVGGARPKALVHKNNDPYLAKFNRLTQDTYNNAKVELACLRMAKEAGLNVFSGKIQTGVNGRDVLLLDRFDVMTDNNNRRSRRHLITINSVLKNSQTQQDRGGVFRYDDIMEIVQKYSVDVKSDLSQLLRMMFFNQTINNTDDHERNFSLINEGNGYRLSPAYDMLPSLTAGAYPVAGYQYSPWRPKPSEVNSLGKIFGLPKTMTKNIADQVIMAIEQWSKWAQDCGVSDHDHDRIKKIIRI